MNRKRAVIAAIVVTAVVAGSLYAWHRHDLRTNDSSEIVLYGNVDIRQVSLAFNASDRIAEMRAREGDRVHAGDVLALLDTRTARLRAAQADARIGAQAQVVAKFKAGSRPEEIAQAKANVSAAEAELDLARKEEARLRSVSEATGGRGVSRQDLDNAAARERVAQSHLESARKAAELVVAGPRREDVAQAESQLQAVKAERGLLQRQLDESELRAPIDGIVRARLLEPGDMASPQRAAYTIAITQPKWVRAYVAEPDLSRVHMGMEAGVTTDSAPGKRIPGRIGYISSVAEFTPKTVQTEELRTALVYEVRIMVDDPDDRLRLGMPATVHIDLNARSPR